jgi:hypothetical protein
VTCTEPLEKVCTDADNGWIQCPAVWNSFSCEGGVPPEEPCGGFLVMPISSSAPGGNTGLCAFDPQTHALVAVIMDGADTPPICRGGVPGTVVPLACETKCPNLPTGQETPWYCDTLPGHTDFGSPCASQANCNGSIENNVCLYGQPGQCGSVTGMCSDPASYVCGAPIPYCACDGTTVQQCNGFTQKPVAYAGPCDGGADADALDGGSE